MFTRGLKNHFGRGFSPPRFDIRCIRTKIARVDNPAAELSLNFVFHGAILLFREITAPDAALVRNHEKFEARSLQLLQGIDDAIKNLNRTWVGTKIDIAHDGAVAIEKDRRVQSFNGRSRHSENWRAILPSSPSPFQAFQQQRHWRGLQFP